MHRNKLATSTRHRCLGLPDNCSREPVRSRLNNVIPNSSHSQLWNQEPPRRSSTGSRLRLPDTSENSTSLVEENSLQLCKDLDVFVEAPSIVTKLDLTKSKALTQPGKLEELVAALLRKECQIQVLNLSCNNFGAAGAVLAIPLRTLTSLQTLSLNWCNLNGYRNARNVAALAPSLRHLSSLKHLHLSHNDLGFKGIQPLCRSLNHMQELQELNLYSNDIGDRGAVELATVLGDMQGLTSLNLSLNDIGVDGIRALGPALCALTGLKKLSLGSGDLGAGAAHAMRPVLEALMGLEALDISSCALGDHGLDVLAPALANLTRLEYLELSHNRISKSEPLRLCLSRMSGLRSLRLGHNPIGGLCNLAEILEPLTSLQRLSLASVNLNPGGAESLSRGLQNCSTGLTSLDLSSNSLIGLSGSHVISALESLSQLRALDLTRSGLRDSCDKLHSSLSNMCGLKRLGLGGNDLGPDEAAILAPALGRLIGLERLGLEENIIGDKGASHLAPGLQRMTSLERINLSKTGIGRQGAVILVPALLTSMRLMLEMHKEDVIGEFLHTALRQQKHFTNATPPFS